MATYGNSAPEKTGDWVQVLLDPADATPSKVIDRLAMTGLTILSFQPTSTPGVCTNVRLGMHVEVLYANSGSLNNPQAKVLGVRFRMENPQEIRFQVYSAFWINIIIYINVYITVYLRLHLNDVVHNTITYRWFRFCRLTTEREIFKIDSPP